MFSKLLNKIVFGNRNIIANSRFLFTLYNQSLSAVRMCEKWPTLDKRNYDETGDSVAKVKKPRIKKKMQALILAYCGQGYLGLQRNAGTKTIEEELMKALLKLEIVNDEEFRKQQLVCFQRAARTDKNVSALRQCINLQMREGVTAEEINQYLPKEIRILSVKRVTKGFNSKNTCCARTYSYTCPSFAFSHKSVTPSEDYRIDDETFDRLNRVTQEYVGSKNFYHFTSGRKSFDPSCRRFIFKAEWQKPVIVDGLELIMFWVKGQSFMLHQIRKMVGTLMAVIRGYVSEDYLRRSFDPNEGFHLPTAPGIGLLLEQVHYDWYNKKYGENGIHDKLDFLEIESDVEEFRKKHIYPVIIKAEKEEKSMLEYLAILDGHYEEYHNDETPDIKDSETLSSDQLQSENAATVDEIDINKSNLESEAETKSEKRNDSDTLSDQIKFDIACKDEDNDEVHQ